MQPSVQWAEPDAHMSPAAAFSAHERTYDSVLALDDLGQSEVITDTRATVVRSSLLEQDAYGTGVKFCRFAAMLVRGLMYRFVRRQPENAMSQLFDQTPQLSRREGGRPWNPRCQIRRGLLTFHPTHRL